MRLIEKAHGNTRDTIAILGAGNCNDLELRWLGENFRTVVLVDLDEEALSYGFRSQSVPAHGNIRPLAPVDITGVLHDGDDRESQEYPRLLKQTQKASLPEIISEPNDVVVSCCVFSAIVETLTQQPVPTDRLGDLVLDFRRQHFELLLASLRKGGRAIFISDCVSSETLPELVSQQPEEASRMLLQCIQRRNFFTGLNPNAIANSFKEPPLSSSIGKAQFISPWIWRLSEHHARLTYAFILYKA